MSIVMVTGGARSGKSTYAEEICVESRRNVTYIACAKITDEDMAKRVELHRLQRPREWPTIEKYKQFGDITSGESATDFYLLDCVTTMITNIMFDEEFDCETCSTGEITKVEEKVKCEIDALLKEFADSDKTLVMVTNEGGQGIVPAYRLGSIFRDIAGRMNQHIASKADEVICMISGLPLKLK